MKDDGLYLVNMKESIDKILSYAQGGWDQFMSSPMEQDAVIRNFEILGEASKRVSKELKEKTPNIPWKKIGGLRDVLIHDYDVIDLEEVWKIVQQNIPGLKKSVEILISEKGITMRGFLKGIDTSVKRERDRKRKI